MSLIMTLALAMTGLAVAGVAWIFADIITRPRETDAELGRFEEERVAALRAASPSFKLLEPWVMELADYFASAKPDRVEKVRKDLVASGTTAPWKPEEYVALARIDAILVGIGGGLLGAIIGGWLAALMLGGLLFWVMDWSRIRTLGGRAFIRRAQIKRKFASAIDLMALMLEVGGNFQESLEVACAESRETPLGDELARIIKDIRMGRTRREALLNMSQRLQDDDLSELTMAIVEGEELGTPLAKTLRIQSDQFRQKRSFWAEKAAAEAQVTLVYPAILIMVACLLTVAAPFVLQAMDMAG